MPATLTSNVLTSSGTLSVHRVRKLPSPPCTAQIRPVPIVSPSRALAVGHQLRTSSYSSLSLATSARNQRSSAVAGSRKRLVCEAATADPRKTWTLIKRKMSLREADVMEQLVPGQTLILGSAAGADTLVVDATGVSRVHAELSVDAKGVLFLTDLNSTNGTAVVEETFQQLALKEIQSGVRVQLKSGGLFQLADEASAQFLVKRASDMEGAYEEDREEYEDEEAEPLVFPGKKLAAGNLRLDPEMLGDGTFGQVYTGTQTGRRGKKSGKKLKDLDITLKRCKADVPLALESLQVELELNHRVSQRAPGVCANYIGHCEVSRKEAGRIGRGQLEEGLWLAWRYQGDRTLDSFLQADDLPGIVEEMQADEDLDANDDLNTVQMVVYTVLEHCARLHEQRLVHRDVKPENLLVTPDGGLALLDLGAMIDFQDGFNYDPEICLQDPLYCPPECEVLPKASGVGYDRRSAGAAMRVLWEEFKPDTFDVYCAGSVLVQLGVRSLRARREFEYFNTQLVQCGNDLAKWRKQAGLKSKDTAIMDANNGAGWELAQLLLQKAAWNGGRQQEDGGRPSAEQALGHRFFDDMAIIEYE